MSRLSGGGGEPARQFYSCFTGRVASPGFSSSADSAGSGWKTKTQAGLFPTPDPAAVNCRTSEPLAACSPAY